MALQVWLPLDGTIDNRGLSNVTVTRNSASFNSNGKIGNCYYNTTDTTGAKCITLTNYMDVLKTYTTYSMCAWIYMTSTATGHSSSILSSGEWNANDGCLCFALYSYSNGYGKLLVPNRSYWNRYSIDLTQRLDINTWYHIAITYDGTKTKAYVNGNYAGEVSTGGICTNSNSNNLNIGAATYHAGFTLKGKINDVRIYDHCLSQKEVSEISQALILHYPLDNVAALMSKCDNITWNQLASLTNASQSTSKNVTYSRTDRKYLNIQTTQDGVSGTGNQTISTNYMNENSIAGTDVFRQQTGHKYYSPNTLPEGFSFAKNNFGNGITPYIDAIQTGFRPSNPSTIQYWIFKGVGGTVVPELVQCPLMIFDLTMMFGEGNEPTKEEFEMMFPYSYYPYDTGTVKNLKTLMPDCSGYKRDGTITGTLSLDSSTPRYRKSTTFNGTNYIQVTSPSTEVRTISLWVKWDSIPSGSGSGYSSQSVVFVDQKSKIGFGLMNTGILCSSNGVYTKVFDKSGIVTNTWYHFAIVNTSDGPTATTRDLYINGVKQTPLTSTNNWAYTLDYLQIGKRSTTSDGFQGSISDFRMYTTVLSAEKIKELYDTGAFVDNHQNLFCYEIVEEDSASPQIDKTGVFHSPEFTETTTVEIYEDELKANQLIEI